MEPQIQYVTTSDGVKIAYFAIGSGRPQINVNIPSSHLQLEWQSPEWRSLYERTAQRRTLVRYDARGLGLSDRDVTDFSVDAMIRDLEAVAGRLGVGEDLGERVPVDGVLAAGGALAQAVDEDATADLNRVLHVGVYP